MNNKLKKPGWFHVENYENSPLSTPLEISIYLNFYNGAADTFSKYQQKYNLKSEHELLSCLDNEERHSKLVKQCLSALKDKYLPISQRKGLEVPYDKIFSQTDSFRSLDINSMTRSKPIRSVSNVIKEISWMDGTYISEHLDEISKDCDNDDFLQKTSPHEVMTGLQEVYLTIDLEAGDKQLKDTFAKLLTKLRHSDNQQIKNLENIYKGITKYKSIQILDLELYASLIGKKLTASVAQEIVSPSEYQSRDNPEIYGEDTFKAFKDSFHKGGSSYKNRAMIKRREFIRQLRKLSKIT
jgi:hypothetical protein